MPEVRRRTRTGSPELKGWAVAIVEEELVPPDRWTASVPAARVHAVVPWATVTEEIEEARVSRAVRIWAWVDWPLAMVTVMVFPDLTAVSAPAVPPPTRLICSAGQSDGIGSGAEGDCGCSGGYGAGGEGSAEAQKSGAGLGASGDAIFDCEGDDIS